MASGDVRSLRTIGGGTFKRALLGYRRADVDEAIAARDSALDAVGEKLSVAQASIAEREGEIQAQASELEIGRLRVDDLERVATRLSERVVERERELRRLRAEMAKVRASSDEGLRTLAALTAELEAVRAQARGQATRIRMRALRDASELSDRIAELSRRPEQTRERLIAELSGAIERLGASVTEQEAWAQEQVTGPNGNGASNGRVDPAEYYEGRVEVEIGPLRDFSQLVGFEDAASGIGATNAISVKRFAKGRATLEMNLREPVELLRELEERAPFEFQVRDTRDDRLVLDVESE